MLKDWKMSYQISYIIINVHMSREELFSTQSERLPFWAAAHLSLRIRLSERRGTIFLFLEQIAPSPSTHARTCCEDFCGWRAGEMASKIPEIFYAFGPQLNAFMSVGILLKYFRRFEWSKTVSNLGMSSFITDQVVFRCFFYKNFTLLHSKSYICKQLFYNTTKS